MRVDSGKFLSVGVLLLISTLAVNGASSRETGIVKDVSVNTTADSVEVKITATEEAKFTYFALSNPHRLVVDFHGIQNTIGFKEKLIESAGVERIRTSFFSDDKRKATRIVFDLSDGVPYRVLEDGGGVVRLVFGNSVRAPLNQTAGPVFVPEPVAASMASPNLPPVRLTAEMLKPEALLPLPQAPPVVVAVSPAPVPQATVPFTTAAQQQQTQITIVPQTPPQIQSTTPTPIPQYTGEIISLDLVDYDIRNFFRLISEFSGLNVVLDPNVSGNVTLTLREVPWDQALDVVLKNNQLRGQLQGNVLRIATNATLQAEEQAQVALRNAQDLAVPLLTRTFVLNYTRAAEVSGLLTRLLSPRGTIIPEPRRNAVIVTDIPSSFGRLDEMVRFVDTPAQQVEIEARLLQANKSFSKDIGAQIGLILGQNGGNVLTGLPGAASPFQRDPPPRATTTGGAGLPLISNFPAAATSGLSFLIQPGGDILLDTIIGAAEARGTAKLLSRPRVMTQNNQAATIQQGTQIPVQTNVNNTITVQFTNFALNLTVTPQITDAGTILLTVNITNSQPDFARAVNGVPSVATQSATTQVLVQDGGTAVIGGILLDTDSVNVRQVPGLGSLPVIGNLFKNTNTVKSTAELLFFITPRIKALDAISVLTPAEEPPAQPR
jgi:type IV pilus assembly protein PilQ